MEKDPRWSPHRVLLSAITSSFLSLRPMDREGMFCVLIRDAEGVFVAITLGLDGIGLTDMPSLLMDIVWVMTESVTMDIEPRQGSQEACRKSR